MEDRLIHQRVFKVSKALNRLDLLCEQHRRQLDPRQGLPDWEQPGTPAGKASRRHEDTPAFFAWNEEPNHPNQTPQKVARTLEMTGDADNSMEDVGETMELPLPSNHIEDGAEEDAAIEVDSDGRSEEEEPVVVGRSIAVSPAKDDILDRVTVASTNTVPFRSSTQPEAPLSPYNRSSSPRYKHGRRLLETEAAFSAPRQPNAAGVTTQQADHYRMSGSSGKRFRSPAKRTSLWDDLSNSYIHQSGNSNRSNSSFSNKRHARSPAERTFGGSSVFRTVNMDKQSRPRPGSTRGERRHVLTGPDAMDVANQAVREFLGDDGEESKGSEGRTRAQHSNVENARLRSANSAQEQTSAPTTRYRKNKRVSFGGDSNVDPSLPQPRTLPVLADKTTQTDDSLLSARKQSRSDRPNRQRTTQDSPARCAACETALDESERPRKMPRGSTDSVHETPAQQDTYRRRRSSNHLTNPIMTNPRYPPQPSAFRGRSTYSSVFNDRLAWR